MSLYQKVGANIINKSKCQFTVWAPEQKNMEILFNDGKEKFPMEKDEYGYWNATLPGINDSAKYKYLINGQNSFPDPASKYQPDGVHGQSQVFDPSEFNWSDQDWMNPELGEYIMYEIHTGTFSDKSNFDGIIDKLDYLLELGINSIEIMPVGQFSGDRNWGYDGVYPFAVQNTYGGPRELQRLVNECHNKGIAVILDVIYNHLGPEGNYLGQFAPYFTDSYNTPWGAAVNFDDEYSYGTRNFFIQNALMWFRDFHIDALRLDAIHAIKDYSARHFMLELAEYTNELSLITNNNHYLIAESNLNDVRYINPVENGGYELDAQWSDDYHHAIHTKLTGDSFGYYMDYGKTADISKALREVFIYDEKYSPFRKKVYGSKTTYNQGNQFVIFNQNHDQVGNRKFGERLSVLTDFEQQKMIAVTLLMTPYIPMLFMGEEYGEENPFLYFVNHNDKHLNELVRKGRKAEFKDFWDKTPAPNPDEKDTFDKSKLTWHCPKKTNQYALFHLHKALIHMRKSEHALRIPDRNSFQVQHIRNIDVITMERWDDTSSFYCAFNFSDSAHQIDLLSEHGEYFELVIDSSSTKWNGHNNDIIKHLQYADKLHLPPNCAMVYKSTLI
jgi:maltooligosyltrehalose trehalohydrolase